jgi:aryl-alcohol dehydrogenase-like predicted oxidoreductase
VEQEYARLYEDIGLGLTTWSPLASGLLTGKYRDGVPAGSRATVENYTFLREGLTHPARNAAVARLIEVAAELGVTMAQLAIGWAARNPRVSSVITGASSVDQLRSNLGAMDACTRLTPELLARIDEITAGLAD